MYVSADPTADTSSAEFPPRRDVAGLVDVLRASAGNPETGAGVVDDARRGLCESKQQAHLDRYKLHCEHDPQNGPTRQASSVDIEGDKA